MIRKLFFLLFINQFLFSQDSINNASNEIKKDSISTKKLEYQVDFINRYIWRGQSWGGNYTVIQPTLKYHINDKFYIGTWATTNFKKDYFYNDGSFYKGYHEIDFFLNYDIKPYWSVQLWDYYWPTVEKVNGIDNSFFNYSYDGVKTLDLITIIDFSEIWIPLGLTVSTLIAGNDFRFDSNGENPKQNFTTYAELSYTWQDVFNKKKYLENIELLFNSGIVLNNQAGYYTAGNYSKTSFVNLSGKITKDFSVSNKISLPIWINYIHNPSRYNTETFGRNFWLFGVSLFFNRD